jgi:hypothetical protein
LYDIDEKEKNCVKDVFNLMPAEELQKLAQTVTNNLLVTTTVQGR